MYSSLWQAVQMVPLRATFSLVGGSPQSPKTENK